MYLDNKERQEVRQLKADDIGKMFAFIEMTIARIDLDLEDTISSEDYKNVATAQEFIRLLKNLFRYLPEAEFYEFATFLDSPLICELEQQVYNLDGREGYRVVKCDTIIEEQKLDEFINKGFDV